MTVSITPTIISSKSSIGIVPSTQFGNVAWNDDGQCMFINKKGATIITPWLLTSLPTPPVLAHASSTLESGDGPVKGEEGEGEGGEDEQMGEPGGASGGTKEEPEICKPAQGEVSWWTNVVEIGASRDKRYDWGGVATDSNWYMRNDDITPRQAVWSPSGLSDLGGCLLAILSSAGQLSVYTPRSDPTRVQWDEVADLTYLTKSLFRPAIPSDEKPSLAQVKEMQATYIAWSPAITHDSYSGIDSSLLAVADRRSGISFWSYGPERRFRRLARIQIGEVWASQMAWSAWKEVRPATFESHLAYTDTDGVVGYMTARRTAHGSETGQRILDCKVEEPKLVDAGDRRSVACLQWLDDILLWTKPGSVHFSSFAQATPAWDRTRLVRLERVGSWAGCNALSTCVGIHRLSSSSIIIILSTLTLHIIHDIHTWPTLAPLHESLVASLAVRQAVLDHIQGDYLKLNRYRQGPTPIEQFTAYTSAWAGLGREGLGFVNFEIINFHNLDTANEGKRLMAFVALDVTESLPGEHRPPIEALRDLLDSPANPLFQSPSRELLPPLMRFLSTPLDADIVSELLDLVAPDDDVDDLPAPSGAHPDEGDLRQAFFIREDLNGIRLKYALALWFAKVSPARKAEFQIMATRLLKFVVAANLAVAARYVSPDFASVKSGSRDERYVRLLADRSRSLGLSLSSIPGGLKIPQDGEPGDGPADDKCPACQQPVNTGDLHGLAKCTNGHSWSRCSITGFLISNPRYRTCSTCPAVALLPSRIAIPPIAVDQRGRARDHERLLRPIVAGEHLVQHALESCTACIICGGRWYRAT